MKPLVVALLVSLLGASSVTPYEIADLRDADRLVILVFGDGGTGKAGQFRVGRAMAETCRKRGCQLALMLGDNMYENGIPVTHRSSVEASLQEILEQFEEKFESPYQRFEEFPDFHFWVALGNHDYRRNVFASYVTYSEFSQLWRMPAFHYEVPRLPDWVQIYALHTDTDVRRDLNGLQVHAAKRALCDEERSDRWKLVFGHQPVYNSGHHANDGNEQRARALLAEPLFQECGVHFYFSGHAHHQEHLTAPGFEQVIQGAAAKSKGRNKSRMSRVTQRHFSREFGFAIVEIDPDELRLHFYDVFDTTQSGELRSPGPEDIFESYSWCGSRDDIGDPSSPARPCR